MTRLAPRTRLAALVLLALPSFALAQETKTAAAKRPDIYDPKADTQTVLDAALKKARHDDTRVLVMFGGNWCGWCHKLHELMRTDAEIATLMRNEYQLVMVDTEAPGAQELMGRCRDALPEDLRVEGFGYPFLTVLGSDGSIVKAQRTDPLEEGDHHDPAKVRAFLAEYKVPTKDAKVVLKDALARATSEDRRVFLHFGAPWCGWCHKLEDFLAREDIAPVMAKDFLDVKIDVDRMEHGQDVLAEYCKKPGGIPWTVILAADGTPIVNSDGPKGNIGYPVEPFEIDHFLAMLRKSARNMEPSDVDRIEAELKAAAAKIRPPAASR